MTKQRKQRATRTTRRGSLLSRELTGGILAGRGFDFQTRYATCHVPVWLLEAAFYQLFYEGTGDIDIRYQRSGHSSRIHVQVKDHEVTPAEFRKAIAQFRQLDVSLEGIYECFKVVSPGLAAKLRPIEAGLARFREAKPFYDDAVTALAPTKEELDERLHAIGLSEDDIDFIHSKVFFEIGHGDLRQDDRAVDLFIARLLTHPDYAGMIRAMVQPAFAELLRAIEGHRGAVLARSDLEDILRAAVAVVGTGGKSITIWLQNWSHETFDPPADYALDWSEHFDRGSRRVPSEEVWNTRLLPELRELKGKISAERPERLIRFRGKCALSSGIALGATFPAVGGWTFEIPQPPARDAWRSDVKATQDYELQVELVEGAGTDLVLGLNIRGDGRKDVQRYIAGTESTPRLFAFMAPSSPGSQAINGSEEACAFARSVREYLGRLVKSHCIGRTRLFFYGPFALSVFLGQQLTSVGEIQLFEYQDPGYVPSCTFRT